jgi:hypothetical protein
VFTQFSVKKSYDINDSVDGIMNDIFLQFDKVQTIFEFEWTYQDLINYLYDAEFYSDYLKNEEDKYSINNFNYLVSNVRLTQRRIKLEENKSSISKAFIKEKWAGDTIKYNQGQQSREFSGTYQNMFSYNKDKSYDQNGGYVLISDVLDIDHLTMNNTIKNYFDNLWLDSQTTSLVLDFVVYNPYLEMLMYTRVIVEVEPSGRLNVETKTDALRRSYYDNGLAVFRTF